MATEVNFEGKKVILPGVYSVVKSGIKNPPISLSYGNVLIIDTGSGAGYGGGSGIGGELASGLDTVYPVDNIEDFRTLVKGGYWYTLAKPLFEPQPQPGVNGVSTVYYVRAATTAAASMSFVPVGGTPNGGTFTVKCRDEGLIGNGALDSGSVDLRKGYAFKLRAGEVDTNKFILEYYIGTYAGAASDTYPYGLATELNSPPTTVVTSIEFDNVADLFTWAEEDSIFQEFFFIQTATLAGDGSVDAADLANWDEYTLASGGTESFALADLTSTLNVVAPLRYSFLLSDKYAADAEDAYNDLYLSHVLDQDTSFEKMVFIGGGTTIGTFTTQSISAAEHFNSDRVVVCHSGVKINSSFTPNKIREWDALYTTCLVLGRIAGLEPQTPGTFKTLPLLGLTHELEISEKKTGLTAGVCMVQYDTQMLTPSYTILQAVNTLQNNVNIVNEDGTTPEISIRRIAAQLNLELTINGRRDLLGGEEGPNLNTLTDRTIIDWTGAQLSFRTATPTDDNLIIEYRNISVNTVQDSKFVTYEFKPNSPVNKFFLTGFMVE